MAELAGFFLHNTT